jgi:hypothetical protein
MPPSCSLSQTDIFHRPSPLVGGQQRNLARWLVQPLVAGHRENHLSFVQAQHYRVALESRAIRKLNHKSETVRIRLRGLEAFMRWVVITFFGPD